MSMGGDILQIAKGEVTSPRCFLLSELMGRRTCTQRIRFSKDNNANDNPENAEDFRDLFQKGLKSTQVAPSPYD